MGHRFRFETYIGQAARVPSITISNHISKKSLDLRFCTPNDMFKIQKQLFLMLFSLLFRYLTWPDPKSVCLFLDLIQEAVIITHLLTPFRVPRFCGNEKGNQRRPEVC